MKTIGKIIADRKFPVREFKSYTFGDEKKCKKIFISTFKEVDKTFKEFHWIPEYDQIVEWMTDTKGKGLALFGSVGRGKTVINSLIMPVLFDRILGKILVPKTTTELTREFINEKWAFLIDDIGTENMINDYGTKIDIFTEAINNAEYRSKLLLLTGNLTEEELIKRYGIMTYDRIKRLSEIVIFSGKSLRQ